MARKGRARRFREAPVWFVEPHPRLAALIRRNVALNGWERSCTMVEAAASDRDVLKVEVEKLRKQLESKTKPGQGAPEA